MTDSPQDILRRVARMSESVRHEQKDALLQKYTSQLSSPMHRQILDCLVGRPCTSLAAKSWASTLIREESQGGASES